MSESLKQLLKRYVIEDTYSFQDYDALQVNTVGRELEMPLHMACRRNAIEDVRLLLAGGANANAQTEIGMTPLMIAVCRNNPQLVRILLEAGVETSLRNIYGDSAASMAESVTNADEVLELLRGRPA